METYSIPALYLMQFVLGYPNSYWNGNCQSLYEVEIDCSIITNG